jgi:hypothetical protein
MHTITCPNCQQAIDIDQALAHQIEENVSAKFQAQKQKLEKSQIDLQKQLETLQQKKDAELKTSLQQQEQKLKRELWEKAQTEAKRQIQESSDKTVKELQQQLQEQQLRAKAAETAELEMRKRQRQLEEKEKQMELQIERELDKRVKEQQEKFAKVETERFSLKEKEYQKQIEDMQRLVEEARRKGSTVSQQLQGEVLELELERQLQEAFPHDIIEEVKKGQFGADVLHTVKNQLGKTVGIIVWEIKQTKDFKREWLPKLREDCRACHGSVAVLVSRTLPDDIKTCAERDRVWITGIDFALSLAYLLRQTLLQVDLERTAQSGKDLKAEMVYQYINSSEFRGRVEGIVESFREMKDDLDKEQRALQNSWKKREKQILRLATNTAYMYGEMQGLVGASLPSIQGLDFEAQPQIESGANTSSATNKPKDDQEELF